MYYTPERVVDYVVEQTVGLLINGSTPKKVSRLRILDPACGSGSFLLVAYQRLLDWHRDWYIASGVAKRAKGKNPAVFQASNGEWYLTTAKRKEILTNNIFGVDIDDQAVEVTKLSLLLKVLEGETESARNLELFQERALPDLGKNILAGNSLVAPDFLASLPTAELVSPDSETARVAPFDWRTAFPQVFNAGGFDVVIGNPPYLSYAGRQSVELPARLRQYFDKHYECSGWPTSHSFFVERSVCLLSSRFVAFIVPDQVGHLAGYESLRAVLNKHSHLRAVKYWGEKVFKGVTTPALTFVADRKATRDTLVVDADGCEATGTVEGGSPWFFSKELEVLERLRADSFSVRPYIADCGVRTTAAKKQVVPAEVARAEDLVCLEGKNFGRYWCSPATKAVRLDQGKVARSADEKYSAAEFLIRQTAAYPIVGPHRHARYFRNSAHALFPPPTPMDIRYLVGLLNSKVMRFAYIAATRESGQKAFPQVKLGALERLPIRSVDWDSGTGQGHHDRVVEMVQGLLDLQRQLETASPQQRKLLEARIKALDEKLDGLVYELYCVSDDDREVIERTVGHAVAAPDISPVLAERGPGVVTIKRTRTAKLRSA